MLNFTVPAYSRFDKTPCARQINSNFMNKAASILEKLNTTFETGQFDRLHALCQANERGNP
jgi:hypothetical protein